MSKHDDVLSQLREDLGALKDHYSQQYKHSEDLLEFWSGRQYTNDEIRQRKINLRPDLEVLNETRVQVNAIVNPFRKAKNSIQVVLPDSEQSYIVNGLIRHIERKSEAQEAYEQAFETAVVGGIGWTILTTDYESDKSLKQTVKVCKVDDIRTVMIDPLSSSVTGSDARFGIVLKYVPKEEIEADFGAEYASINSHIGVYKKWYLPKNAIPVLTYYRKSTKTVKRWYFADGTYLDQRDKPLVPFVGKRDVQITQVEVFKLIGDKIVDETVLPIDCIPIVPWYGDRVERKDAQHKWTGAVEWMKTPQRLINDYLNQEKEILRNVPISPWLATKEQVQGLGKYWSRANTTAFDTLLYNQTEAGGAPTRVDTSANSAPAQAGRNNAHGDLQKVTGIYDAQLGNAQGAPEQSGVALMLRDSFGDRTNTHYYSNAEKSLQQVGYIMVQLLKHIYPEETELTLRNEYGAYETTVANVAEILNGVDDLEVEVTVGTMAESKRKQDLEVLTGVASILPEDKKTLLLDLMVDAIESPSKAVIKERISKVLPPEAQAKDQGAPDPAAIQALQAAEQTVAQLEQNEELLKQYIVQLQNRVAELENDSRAMLAKAQMDNQTKLEIEAMKQQGDNERLLAKMLAEAETRMEAKIAETIKALAKTTKVEDYDDDRVRTDLEGPQL